MAMLLTPPPAPTTRTLSPARSPARWINIRQAASVTKRGAAAIGEVQGLRHGHKISSRHRHVLRGPAPSMLAKDVVARADTHFAPPRELILKRVDAGVAHHALTHLPSRDALAQFDDLACHIGAAPVGHLQLETGPAATDPDVQVVDGAGPNPKQHLAVIRFRVVHIAVANHIKVAVLH